MRLNYLGYLLLHVNNAGVNIFQPISSISEDEYDEMFNTNTKSHVFLTQLALPFIIKNKGNSRPIRPILTLQFSTSYPL